ncbi:16S rRNA (guanine(966)-N(2))-methyltransferase RsmD [Lysobacter sp. H21R4]|uniref:16S rRNA (guanine(966)-N(2))-methyltransferase RsmD n=1 Tax=Lysobacter sp. H21R4 TaxID=2781021 RepID=UPI0018893736|nr:16S rRNA (guanine(966)-N(2))-methyltransferase RsmD [Lysobacter sp. H21R4]QOY63580.1 16S rRNA (guanine(966)-N(2))-methyltransferase RsmD [Lysobacter sp. H21R4]
MKKPVRNPSRAVANGPGQVRVIGGRWRGSKLPVVDSAGLRPTPDRVRETLFNWLAPVIDGASVLDLFAGSGALGLEALSRGAASAVLVERDPVLAASLLATTQRLQGGQAARVVQADAMHWLPTQPRASFDIAFVDPPFATGLLEPALAGVLPLMRDGAWLHVEGPVDEPVTLPGTWSLHREGRTREIRHALYRHRPVLTAGDGTRAGVDTLPVDPARPDVPDLERFAQ